MRGTYLSRTYPEAMADTVRPMGDGRGRAIITTKLPGGKPGRLAELEEVLTDYGL